MSVKEFEEEYITPEFGDFICGKTIVFTKEINNWDCYAEEGMMAIVSQFEFDEEESDQMEKVHTIHLDFSPFEEHNHSRQRANYYDMAGQPILTAVEAGFYRPHDKLYVSGFKNQLPIKVKNDSI